MRDLFRTALALPGLSVGLGWIQLLLRFLMGAKLPRAHAVAALQVFVSAIYLALLVPGVALLRLYLYGWADAWAWALIALLTALSAVPLPWLDGTLPHRIMGLIVGSACNYFPISVQLEASDPRGVPCLLQQAVRLVPICTLQPDKGRLTRQPAKCTSLAAPSIHALIAPSPHRTVIH